MILGVIIVSQYVGVSFYLKQLMSNITSNNRKTGANFVKCWTVKLCIHVSKGPVMNQSKSIYGSPFKDSLSHPIHSCLPIIVTNYLLS